MCTALVGRSYLPGKAPRKATLTAAGRRRPELPQGREHSDSGPGHSRGFEPMSACPSVSDWALMPSRPEEGRQPEGCQNSDSALNIGFDTFILSACVRLRTAHQVRRAASCSNLKTSGRGKISHSLLRSEFSHSTGPSRKLGRSTIVPGVGLTADSRSERAARATAAVGGRRSACDRQAAATGQPWSRGIDPRGGRPTRARARRQEEHRRLRRGCTRQA